MEKILFSAMMCLMALTMNAQSYVDLGLPSGTKWKSQNEKKLYTYDDAVSQFANHLPTKDQWEELNEKCQWSWTSSGYKVTGPNGKSIFLPAEGYRFCDGSIINVGDYGYYWSSTPLLYSERVWYLTCYSDNHFMGDSSRCCSRSVRLVQN